ncbi:MAG: hypothetical protein COA63_013925 [Methylophaga sp.]|nr:hypothetical protein [Methylophaga sp.]
MKTAFRVNFHGSKMNYDFFGDTQRFQEGDLLVRVGHGKPALCTVIKTNVKTHKATKRFTGYMCMKELID